ncbi:MAG: transcriptional repressor [Planctomycetota bacterium]
MFRKRGLRCTKQRELVYASLAASKAHPTAEELFLSVKGDSDVRLSLATVYNTLDMLVEAGLARRLVIAEGPARYDADTADHVHLTMSDGRIMDVPEDLSDRILDRLPEDLVGELERRTGLRIERIGIQLQAQTRDRH